MSDFYERAQLAKDYQFMDLETVKRFVKFRNQHDYGFGTQIFYLESIGIDVNIQSAYSK